MKGKEEATWKKAEGQRQSVKKTDSGYSQWGRNQRCGEGQKTDFHTRESVNMEDESL